MAISYPRQCVLGRVNAKRNAVRCFCSWPVFIVKFIVQKGTFFRRHE